MAQGPGRAGVQREPPARLEERRDQWAEWKAAPSTHHCLSLLGPLGLESCLECAVGGQHGTTQGSPGTAAHSLLKGGRGLQAVGRKRLRAEHH